MKELLVVRHGIAGPRSLALPDAERALTKKGLERFFAVVRGLDELGILPDRVLTSPWRRAHETAEILADAAGTSCEPTDLLAADPGEELLARVREEDAGRIALIGHEPWVSELTALLATGDAAAGDAFCMKKGGVAWLRGEAKAGGAQLLALLPPKVFFLRS